MAFLSRYRSLRQSNATGLDEIEFNFGRAFQQLGIFVHSLVYAAAVIMFPRPAFARCQALRTCVGNGRKQAGYEFRSA